MLFFKEFQELSIFWNLRNFLANLLKCKSFQLEVSGCQKLFAIYFDVVKNFWPVFYRKLMKNVTCEIFISQKRFRQFLGSCIPGTNTKIQGRKRAPELAKRFWSSFFMDWFSTNQDLLFLLSFLKAEAKERNSGQQRKNACQDAWLSVLFTGLRELSCSGCWGLGYWCRVG